MNNFGFLIETVKPLPTEIQRFGKKKGKIPYMSKKEIISSFGKKEKQVKKIK